MKLTYNDLYLLYVGFLGVVILANVFALALQFLVVLFFRLRDLLARVDLSGLFMSFVNFVKR